MYKPLNIIVIVIIMTSQTLKSQDNQEYKYVQSDTPMDSAFFHYLLHQSVQSIFLHYDVITGGWAKSFVDEFNDPENSDIIPYITWEFLETERPEIEFLNDFMRILKMIGSEVEELEVCKIDKNTAYRKSDLFGCIPFEYSPASFEEFMILNDTSARRLHFLIKTPMILPDGKLYFSLTSVDKFGNFFSDFYVAFSKCLFGNYYIPTMIYRPSAFVYEWHKEVPIFELNLNNCEIKSAIPSNDYERK